MKKQPTVLLVRGIEMPRRIAEHLRTLEVHVEQASPAALGAVLAAFRLELIVIGLPPAASALEPILLAVQKAISAAKQSVPLVALADWSEEKPPGARAQVDAVVPIDLPDPAIAHRLKTLAERAAAGDPLDNRNVPASRRVSNSASRNQKSPHRPLVPRAKPINRRPLPRSDEARALQEAPPPPSRSRPPMGRSAPPPPPIGLSSAVPPRPRRRTTPPPTCAEAEKIRQLCEEWEQGDPHNRLSDWLFNAGAQMPTRDTEPPLSGSLSATVRPGAETRAELKTPSPEEHRSSSIPSAAHVGTSPSSIRVPLTTPAEPLSGVRIAIVDEDLTRADALAITLRAHRVQVHLCSPLLAHFHPRLLRKFAPHAIVVDEALLRGPASELVALIRKDLFLAHVRLLVVNLSRYFRPRTGATQLDALLPLIKPLAQGEQDLLAKLGPTCEVEFGFDEVPPHLLLKLLVPRSVSTQIECNADGVCLTWTVGWNQAAPAELTQGEQKLYLNPERAFDWLLAHQDCRVVIIQRPEREALVGEAVLPLIDKRLAEESGVFSVSKTAATETRLEFVSNLPGQGSDQKSNTPLNVAQSHPPQSLAPASSVPHSTNRPHAISYRAEAIETTRRNKVFVACGAIAAAAGVTLVFAQLSSSFAEPATTQLSAPDADAVESSIQASHAEPDSALPHDKSDVSGSASPGEVNLTRAGAALLGNPSRPQDGEEQKAHDASSVNEGDARVVSSGATGTSGAAGSTGLLFRIDENRQVPDCDEVLGGWVPHPQEPREAGRIYFRQAQKDLVQGENGQAHYKLCQAAHLMPGGGGSLELARYYLGLRAYSLADKYLQSVLELGDKSGEVQLLHGDLLNQQGQDLVSRDIWLAAIQVSADDETKCVAVSRKYVRDARSALRYLDYALAERYLRRSVTLWRDNVEAAALLSELFKKQGFEAAALAWHEEARRSR